MNTIDQFADWDLQRIAKSRHRTVKSLSEVVELVQEVDGDFLIGGGLESHLTDLEPLATHVGWKNSPLSSLKRSRDPYVWSPFLESRGFPIAAVRTQTSTVRTQTSWNKNRWLRKNNDSTGGMGVAWESGQGPFRSDEFCYFQEFVSGLSLSSLHVCNGSAMATLGVFLQLVGAPHSRSSTDPATKERLSEVAGIAPFQFVGSIGPLNPELQKLYKINQEEIHRAVEAIAEFTQLRGVFGIDWVLDERSRVIPIEINPRPTASGELWEMASRKNLVAVHLDAIRGGCIPASYCSGLFGRAFVFHAGRDVNVDGEMHQKMVSYWKDGWVADVPCPGVRIQRGQPVATVFARDDSLPERQAIIPLRQILFERMERIRAVIAGARKTGSDFASR